MKDAVRVIAFIAGVVLAIGLATHWKGTTAIIDSITGFFGTGLSAELGQLPAPVATKRGRR